MTETVTRGMRVPDRHGFIRWAVVATYAKNPAGAWVCVEYRVRVVGDQRSVASSARAAHRLISEMVSESPDASTDMEPIPPSGIPRYVFEVASPSRLLAEHRQAFAERPRTVPGLASPAVRDLLEEPRRRQGRPPARSLAEKLSVLADVESALHQPEGDLNDVASAHNMSRSSLRDLLHWARHSAKPRLFTPVRPGVRGGELTEDARVLLTELKRKAKP